MPEFKENTSPAMKRSGFKMKGYTYPGTSPMQSNGEKEKETKRDKVSTTYEKDALTKTKGKESSKYTKTSSEKILSGIHKGKNKVTYTNDLGNTEVRVEA